MNAAALQAVILTLVAIASGLFVLRRLLPTTSRRIQSGCARWLQGSAHGAALRRIGHWIEPASAKAGDCGSGGGCSSCGGCASASEVDPVPLRFKSVDRS